MGNEAEQQRPAPGLDPSKWVWQEQKDYLHYYRLINSKSKSVYIPFNFLCTICARHPDILDDLPLAMRRAVIYINSLKDGVDGTADREVDWTYHPN